MTARIWPVDAVAGAPSFSGRALRQTMSPTLGGATSARPLGARSGVRPGTPFSTVAATSTTWTVHPFAGIIDGEAAAEAGGYAFAFDADVTGAVNAANGSNPRKDLISIKVSDPAEGDGSSTPSIAVEYTAGTAASTPAVPATPARSVAIAVLNVPVSGGGSPSVTFVAPFIAAAGGVVYCRDSADLTAYTTASAPMDGSLAYQNDVDTLWLRIDGAWAPIGGKLPTWSAAWTSAQAVASNTIVTASNFGTPVVSHPTLFSLASGVVTVQCAGWYDLSVAFASDGTDEDKYVFVTKNGTTTHVLHYAMKSGKFRPDLSKAIKLAAGDTIRLRFLRGTADFFGPNPDDGTLPALQLVYLHP